MPNPEKEFKPESNMESSVSGPEIPDYAEFMPMSKEQAAIEATRILNSSRVGAAIMHEIDFAEATKQLDKIIEEDTTRDMYDELERVKEDELEMAYQIPSYNPENRRDK